MTEVAKRLSHVAIIEAYTSPDKTVGVLVELDGGSAGLQHIPALETLAHELALQISATDPQYASTGQVPRGALAALHARFEGEAVKEGSAASVARIVAKGKVQRLIGAAVLLEQPYIRDESRTVGDVVQELATTANTTITVRRFSRMHVDDSGHQVLFGDDDGNDDGGDDAFGGLPSPRPSSPPRAGGQTGARPPRGSFSTTGSIVRHD